MRCRLPSPQLPGAHRELASQMRLRAGFLVAHVHPFDLALPALPADRVRQAVKAVADNIIDALDSRGGGGFGKLIGHSM
jgi:hypothetical protein